MKRLATTSRQKKQAACVLLLLSMAIVAEAKGPAQEPSARPAWAREGRLQRNKADTGATLAFALGIPNPFQVSSPSSDLTQSYSVTGLHFGSADVPLGAAPTSGECLGYNGTNITGAPCGSSSATGLTFGSSTLSLSSTPPASGQVLEYNGATLVGATINGTPGGANTAVQFNSGASFGGDATNFYYNPTTHSLTVTGSVTASSFISSSAANGCLTLNELPSSGTTNISICAPSSVPSSVSWIWPAADGASGQVLTTNGSGTLSWASPSGTGLSGLTTNALLKAGSSTTAVNSGLTDTGATISTNEAVNFSGAQHTQTVATGSTLPSTCSVGELFFLTTATAGQNLYECTAANTWTQQVAGTGGGTAEAPVTFYAMGDRTSGMGFVANQVRLNGFLLPVAVTFSHLTIAVGTADSVTTDLYSWGIYNSAGKLAAHVAPVALTSAGVMDASTVEGSVTLEPGKYYFAFTGTAGTASFLASGSFYMSFLSNTYYSGNSNAALPASITPPADNIQYMSQIQDLALQ